MTVRSSAHGGGAVSAALTMKKAHVQRLLEGAAAAGFMPQSIRLCSNGDIVLDRTLPADPRPEDNDDEALFAAWKGGAHAAAA